MDSVLREEEVVTVLENDLGKEFRLKEFTVKLASDNLTGFLGEHYMLEVQIQGQPRTLSYFVKKIPTRVPEHSEYALKTGAFYKEVELYKTLFVDMKNSQSNKEKPTKWHPECFYTREHDLFVLENLTEAGYYMYPRTKLMDEDHIKSSLRAMAAMHAASIVFEEKFNQKTLQSLSGVQLDPTQSKVTVGDVYSNLTFETEASDVKGHPGNTFHEAGIQSQLEIVRLLPEYTAEEQKLIADKLPKILRHFLQLVKTSDKYKNVFIHGDLWTNNLLFRKDKNGKVNHAIIIDFQLARYAPPAHDLLMFLHLVQNKSFLDLHQQELFRYYYEAFAQELQKNSIDVEAILPWKIFSESCDFYQDLGLICKLFYFQLILIPEELLGKFMNTPESFMRNMMVDRSELALACFAKSESYKARVTEALNEVIKKFILIPVKN